jgi:hypothetical protein
MSNSDQGAGLGCGGCIALVLVLGAIVAAAMSIAALVDPFSWMPPIHDVFADCAPTVEVDGSCDLEDRYPGFWLHVVVNLAYSAAAVGSLVALVPAVAELRQARAARFDGDAAVERYRAARQRLGQIAVPTAALALLPLVVGLL